ncbi:MAG: DUF3800 domain-containing protein [Arcobacteraceae bacterium]|nr:DUF3800 domain-containing protein [Arcobacteraceae bacterium]
MYLVYADETGTNFSEKSPYLLYGGLVVHESKVNILESQLEQMIAKFLGLDDVKKVELHTSEIFTILFHENFDCQSKRKQKDKLYCEELKQLLQNVSVDDFINFTDELIQFLTKMNIPLMVSVVNKTDEIHTKHRLNKEVSAIAYSFKMFLNTIDRFLSSKNEKALLIVDAFENQTPSKINSLPFYERIKDENIATKDGTHKELVILRTLHESMLWKTNNSEDFDNIAPLKYEFESKSLFLLDNINYTKSKDSIMNQVADFMLFILRKVLEVNNSNEIIENENLNKLVETIDSSLLFSKNNNDIKLSIIGKDNDINFIGSNFSANFKDVCSYLK